jgi:hypothetical protein
MIARGDPADIMRAQRPPGCFPFARVRPDKTLPSDISLFHKPPRLAACFGLWLI